MNNAVAVAIAAAAGISAAIQSAMNAAIGRIVGTLGSVLLSFLVGTTVAVIVVLVGGRADLSRWHEIPLHYWLAGVLGVFIVFGMIVAVPKVGLATASTALVVAQIITAVIADHFGWFGVDRIAVTPLRLLGVGLLVVALRLVFQ